MANEQQLAALRASLELTQTGFAGLDRNGQKVDRRENFHCVPIAKNSMLNIPAPRCLMCKQEREVEEIKDISCIYCLKEERKRTEDMYNDLREMENKIRYTNKKLITECCKVRGKSFKKYLKAVIEACEIGGYDSCYEEFQIVDKPKGKYQSETEEGYGSITGFWVEQWSIGLEGDSYSGHITVIIKQGIYLQMPFSC
jgi:hypothetical protein